MSTLHRDSRMKTLPRASIPRALLVMLTAGLLLGSAAAVVATRSPEIVPIGVDALTTVPTSPLEDTPYWSVVGDGARPPAASVSAFVSSDKLLEAGVSRYDRVTLELHDWPIDEFMYIVEGQVEITPKNGQPRIYGPGDAFVMPKGFSGTWRQLTDLRKIQVSYSGTT